MTESSQKIRTDFLKSLGIIKPCPCDFEFIEPIPDNQLLKAVVHRAKKNGSGFGIIAIRYNLKKYRIRDAFIRANKTQ